MTIGHEQPGLVSPSLLVTATLCPMANNHRTLTTRRALCCSHLSGETNTSPLCVGSKATYT